MALFCSYLRNGAVVSLMVSLILISCQRAGIHFLVYVLLNILCNLFTLSICSALCKHHAIGNKLIPDHNMHCLFLTLHFYFLFLKYKTKGYLYFKQYRLYLLLSLNLLDNIIPMVVLIGIFLNTHTNEQTKLL